MSAFLPRDDRYVKGARVEDSTYTIVLNHVAISELRADDPDFCHLTVAPNGVVECTSRISPRFIDRVIHHPNGVGSKPRRVVLDRRLEEADAKSYAGGDPSVGTGHDWGKWSYTQVDFKKEIPHRTCLCCGCVLPAAMIRCCACFAELLFREPGGLWDAVRSAQQARDSLPCAAAPGVPDPRNPATPSGVGPVGSTAREEKLDVPYWIGKISGK